MKNFLERVEQGIVDHPKRVVLSLLGVIIAILCINFALTYCAHEWQAATCSAPETCIKCGKTRERRLAHQWDAATCVSPATCSVCGAQKGEPIAHVWQEATCTAPKTCSACGQTEGEPLAHNVTKWEVVTASTCTQAGTQSGTCDVCKQTITEALPLAEHTPSDWQIINPATADNTGTKAQICTVCGETVKTTSYLSPEAEIAKDKADIKRSLDWIVDYTSTDVSEISVNENLGTDDTGDYVALVHLEWDVENSTELTKKVLAMYSDDLAARTGTDIPKVSELSVFWVVPYYSKDIVVIKYSYNRLGDKMYKTDEIILI